MIRLEKISKIYRTGEVDFQALDQVDLEIRDGEFVAILGASGSGKSTLMNILGCLDQPTSGRYLLDEHEVSKLSRNQLAQMRNLKIGFVFQSFNLLPRTTALENVELPLQYRKQVSRAEKVARGREMLAKVGIAEKERNYPNQMSGGQQQRVAIARALVTKPALLLADEPTGNLDSKTSVEILALMQELNEAGITIAIVTHEPDIAAYTKRFVALRDGKIIQDEINKNRQVARP